MYQKTNLVDKLQLFENENEHVDLTCYNAYGHYGVIEVYARGGVPPYEYSIDNETWQSSGHFDNLTMPEEYVIGKDENGMSREGNILFFVRDSVGNTATKNILLKSPEHLYWYNQPSEHLLIGEDIGNPYIIDYGAQTIRDFLIFLEDSFDCGYASTPNMNMLGKKVSTRQSRSTHNTYKKRYECGVTSIRYSCVSYECRESHTAFLQVFVFPHFLTNAVQDYDGNWYDAVILGNHVWLANNLKTTHYANGEAIESDYIHAPGDSDNEEYPVSTWGYHYDIQNTCPDVSTLTHESVIQGVSPTGWHIPNELEVNDLLNFVSSQDGWPSGGINNIAKALSSNSLVAESENAEVDAPNYQPQTTNNASKFNAEYAAESIRRGSGEWGNYGKVGKVFSFGYLNISQGKPYYLQMQYFLKICRQYAMRPNYLHSVRCVSDLTPLEFCKWYFTQYGTTNHQIS